MNQIKIGLIGGSGLGEALGAQTTGARHEVQTPFGRPSDAVVETEWAGLPVFFLSRHGPGHLLNPSQVPSRANVFALKALGCTHVIASGAVGSLREEFKPRDLVVPDQVIDKTRRRADTFYDRAAVHAEFAEPFCPVLRQIVIEAGQGAGAEKKPAPAFAVHDRGCYVCMEGPAFSTRAESLMHRLWGGDLIGMTALPEAKLAREAELSYALVALVTDYDCWRHKPADPGEKKEGGPPPVVDPFVLLEEIIGHLRAASENAIGLMRRAVELIAADPARALASPARHALRLAIWSDKARIAPEEIVRLRPLWGKYFEAPEAPPAQPAGVSGGEENPPAAGAGGADAAAETAAPTASSPAEDSGADSAAGAAPQAVQEAARGAGPEPGAVADANAEAQ